MTKLHIVLDLDATVIYSADKEESDGMGHTKTIEKLKKNKVMTDKLTYHDMDETFLTFERPNLQKFLDELFKLYDVSVWTAASGTYAAFIVDKILLQDKPERKLLNVLFRYHGELSDKHCEKAANKRIECPKLLDMLYSKYGLKEYNLKRTIILDDYNRVVDPQRNNAILVPEFKVENQKKNKMDTYLMKTLLPALKNISKHYRQHNELPKPLLK